MDIFTKSYECILEENGKVKFFCAKQFTESFIEFVVQAIDQEQFSSYVVALPNNSS